MIWNLNVPLNAFTLKVWWSDYGTAARRLKSLQDRAYWQDLLSLGHGFEGNIETLHPFLSLVLLLTFQEESNVLLNVLSRCPVLPHAKQQWKLWPDTMSSTNSFPNEYRLFKVLISGIL